MVGLALMHVFSLSTPAEALLVAGTTSVLARLFAALEGGQRLIENILYSRYVAAVERSRQSFRPGRLIRRAGLNMVVVGGMSFCVCLSGFIALFCVILPWLWPYLTTSRASWSQLWLLGSLGGILSLRYRPAYVLLAVGAGAALLWPLLRGLSF
jgi:PTS system mannose-specific IIC component